MTTDAPAVLRMALPRISAAAVATFRAEFLQPQLPCIVTGLSSGRAHDLWTHDYLRGAYGDREVRASASGNHIHPDLSHEPTPPPTRHIRFKDYVDLVWSGTKAARHLFVIGDNLPLYRRQDDGPAETSAMMGHVEMPVFVDKDRLRFAGCWLTAQGTASWLHYDANGCHNLNLQVRGRKRVFLYSPDQCRLLYPYERTSLSPNFGQFSRVDVFAPDFDRFPLFAQAAQWSGTLDAGEALFIPAYWYHAFQHEGDVNINVNFWWTPERQLLNGLTAREALLAALADSLPGRDQTQDIATRVAALGEPVITILQELEHALLAQS